MLFVQENLRHQLSEGGKTMDKTLTVDPPHDPLDIVGFRKSIDDQQDAIAEAMREMGVMRDEPLAKVLSAVIYSQRRFSESTMNAVAEISRITANLRLAGEGDVLQQRKIQRETIELNAELRRVVTEAVGSSQQERRDLHKSLLGEILPKMWEALQQPLIIRETRHNYATLMSGALVVSGVIAAVFFTGFFLSLWTDWRGSERLDDVIVAVARCEVAPPVLDARGVRYCPMEPFLPKHHGPVRAAGDQTSSR